jgi:anhydro-N-acetylmuramic acid kinase
MHSIFSPRWFAGISISATCRRIESAVIGIHGHGSGAPVEIRKTISFDIPREITDSFNTLQGIVYESAGHEQNRSPERVQSNMTIPAALYHHVVAELASIEEEAITELLGEARLTANDVLAVGVNDSGIRNISPNGLFYLGLCDASSLSQQTGLNIVDNFPANDIAAHGNGGPLLPLPFWIFLKSEERNRVLLDLGRTARITFIPQSNDAFSYQKIRHQDIIPCGSLLDMLIWQLTDGKASADVGGRIAVQGQKIPELLAKLHEAVSVKTDWMPLGLMPDRYLQIAAAAAQNGHAAQDILCTVCAFIAEQIARASIAQGENVHNAEILVTGSCRLHGLLMNLLSGHFGGRSLTSVSQLGIPADTLDSLCTAMMTLLTVEHIPGNLPQLTGCDGSKILGRLTPGSTPNWHRLLNEMAHTKPADTTIRRAA